MPGLVFGSALVVATVWLYVAIPGFAEGYGPLVTLAYLTVSTMISFLPVFASSSAGMPASDAQPWQETPVKVLNTYGTVLVLPDGRYVRVNGLPAALREVVVRAGRVWIVGPDAAGNLAIRADGPHTAWPARLIEPLPGTAALPTGEPVAVMSMRLKADALRLPCVMVTTCGLSAVLFALPPKASWLQILAVLVACAYVTVVVACWSWYLSVRRRRQAGYWVQVEATAPSWRTRRSGLADGTVTLSFPDGRKFSVRIKRAPLDLFANVVRERTLWVADNWVVGYPHYPIAATARFTEIPREALSPVG